MPIVYGLFADERSAEAVADVLRRPGDAHGVLPVQTHTKQPLDGNYLPESATEIGRNTTIAIIVGAIVGLALGALAGATLDIMGLTLGIGAVFGLMTGVLSGMLGGMMAGTRQPKAPLREAAAQLGGGKVLMTIEVEDPSEVRAVEQTLESGGALDVGCC